MPRQDALLTRVADSLGLRELQPLTGGEFGACIVAGPGDELLVLKALPMPDLAPKWARGVAQASLMRARGYPAPAYLGTGVTSGAVWSLQERLPGEAASELDDGIATELVRLLDLHPDAAEDELDDAATRLTAMRRQCRELEGEDESRDLALAIRRVLDRSEGIRLRTRDVVHADFHHGNVLVDDGRVTGVFDWEGARPGDCRSDLANLVVSASHPHISERVRREPADVVAFFVAYHALRYLDYTRREHREHLGGHTDHLVDRVMPWLDG